MTADLIMPAMAGNPHFSNHFLPGRPVHHVRSQSYQLPPGPQISPLSTSDLSDQGTSTPSSPKAHHARQLRPLYMPAVLRPNAEFAVKAARVQAGIESEPTSAVASRRSSNSFINIPGIGGIGTRLTRRSTGDSGNSFDDEFDLDLFPEVTAQPTRTHWKPDPESSICDDPICKRNFSYFTRRHHCRRCGNIFCDSHSNFGVPLDQDAKFNPRAEVSRTCNHCFEEFKVWHTRNNSRASSTTSSEDANVPATPMAAAFDAAKKLPKGADLAASVPRDWLWSTF